MHQIPTLTSTSQATGPRDAIIEEATLFLCSGDAVTLVERGDAVLGSVGDQLQRPALDMGAQQRLGAGGLAGQGQFLEQTVLTCNVAIVVVGQRPIPASIELGTVAQLRSDRFEVRVGAAGQECSLNRPSSNTNGVFSRRWWPATTLVSQWMSPRSIASCKATNSI